jgi:hypothetical protein
MFPECWGSAEAEVLGMLGLAQMFHLYSLQAMYGQRYIRNELTAKFMGRYGFRDMSVLPDFMLCQNGSGLELGGCVVSRLSCEDFSSYVARALDSVTT